MSAEDLVKKIQSVAYWRVVIRPTEYDAKRILSLSRCKELMEKSQVVLRGWDYPHVERIQSGESWVEDRYDWEGRHLEYWRFYQSGQFVHHFSCPEEFSPLTNRAPAPDRYLSVENVVYTLTEILEFASRMAKHDVLTPSVEISIQLRGMMNRELTFTHSSRWVPSGSYVSRTDHVSYELTTSEAELRARSQDLALDAAVAIFERFGWFNPSRTILAEDQRKLLERRLGV